MSDLAAPLATRFSPHSFRLLLVTAQAATIAITWPLWQVRDVPPNLPLVPLAQFNVGWWLLASLGVVLARPAWGIALHGLLLAGAMALDQTRIQPQLISHTLLLLGTLPAKEAQLIARVHLLSLWFYAALHKFVSRGYWDDIVPWLWSGWLPDGPRPAVVVFGIVVAALEMALAVLALVPRTRRLAAGLAVVFHLGVLLSLSPLGLNWNPSVWPWNVALALAGVALVAPWTTTLWAGFRGSRFIARAVAMLLLLAPLGYYLGVVDPYLAHCLYAGNTPEAYLHKSGKGEEQLRFLPEINAPLPPAHRIFEQYYFAVAQPDDLLEIRDPRWLATRQGWARRTITKSGEFRGGVRHGRWTRWHANGRKLSEGVYAAGKQEGLWTFWSEDGRKEAEGTFHDDQMDGTWTFYYDQEREVHATYRKGERVKEE